MTPLIRVATVASRTVPRLTCQTIVSESPAWAGMALASSCWAVVEPVPGSEKELLKSLLTAWDSVPRPTSTSTQAAMTANRWRKHHLAMADMNLPVLTDVTSSIVRDRGQARRRPDGASFTYRDRGRAAGWLPHSQVP